MSDSELNRIKKQNQMPAPILLPSPKLGEWLYEMNGSLLFSTYQSARIFFVSGAENGETTALERVVGSAMGLAVDRDKLWITNKEQAWRFTNVGPRSLKVEEDGDIQDFDAVFMPRWGIFLGPCDTHDVLANVDFNGRKYELLFVNTNFSCISSIDGHYSFIPVWKPDFVSGLSPEDRCHLNGMGAKDGKLAYVTVCGKSDTAYGWKSVKSGGGMLIDVQSNQVITTGLSMPHSPRWYDNKIWLLNSGDGQYGYVEPETGVFHPVLDCPGFARGLHIVGHYAVIGLSKLRENTFASGLNIKQKLEDRCIPQRCGLLIFDLKAGKTVHWLTIEGHVSELYDVAFLPEIKKPFTPGFGYPNMHKYLLNIPNYSDFPLVPPSQKTQQDNLKVSGV